MDGAAALSRQHLHSLCGGVGRLGLSAALSQVRFHTLGPPTGPYASTDGDGLLRKLSTRHSLFRAAHGTLADTCARLLGMRVSIAGLALGLSVGHGAQDRKPGDLGPHANWPWDLGSGGTPVQSKDSPVFLKLFCGTSRLSLQEGT